MDAAEWRAEQLRQGELWEEKRVEATWFHIVRSMFHRQEVAAMGAIGFTVYAAIKSHTDFRSGEAFPSIAVLAREVGVSQDSVLRAVKHLRELGVLRVEKRGRRNVYRLIERVPVSDADGAVVATAERPYTPSGFSDFVRQLQEFAERGNLPPDKAITLNITLNVQNIQQGDGGRVEMVVQNIQQAPQAQAPSASPPLVHRAKNPLLNL